MGLQLFTDGSLGTALTDENNVNLVDNSDEINTNVVLMGQAVFDIAAIGLPMFSALLTLLHHGGTT
jgi:hypothetical protein